MINHNSLICYECKNVVRKIENNVDIRYSCPGCFSYIKTKSRLSCGHLCCNNCIDARILKYINTMEQINEIKKQCYTIITNNYIQNTEHYIDVLDKLNNLQQYYNIDFIKKLLNEFEILVKKLYFQNIDFENILILHIRNLNRLYEKLKQ